MARPRLPDSPAGAERRLADLVRRIHSAARRIIAAQIREQWPGFSPSSCRMRLAWLLDAALRDDIARIGEDVVTSWLAWLRSEVGTTIPPTADDLVAQWVREVVAALSPTPRRLDARQIRADVTLGLGISRLVTLAQATVAVARSRGEDAAAAVRAFGRRAVSTARSSANRAMHSVYSLGSRASNAAQRRAGLERYRWRTRRDALVRPYHRALDDTEQRWDDPPVISPDGRRGHPGEDYNCRCVAIPVRVRR